MYKNKATFLKQQMHADMFDLASDMLCEWLSIYVGDA